MSKRDNYGGLYNFVVGAALFLASLIGYHLVTRWWERRNEAAYLAQQQRRQAQIAAQQQTPAPTPDPSAPQPGPATTPTTVPMLMMQRAPKMSGGGEPVVPHPSPAPAAK